MVNSTLSYFITIHLSTQTCIICMLSSYFNSNWKFNSNWTLQVSRTCTTSSFFKDTSERNILNIGLTASIATNLELIKVNVLNVIELYILKWVILCYVNFTTIKKNQHKDRKYLRSSSPSAIKEPYITPQG